MENSRWGNLEFLLLIGEGLNDMSREIFDRASTTSQKTALRALEKFYSGRREMQSGYGNKNLEEDEKLNTRFP